MRNRQRGEDEDPDDEEPSLEALLEFLRQLSKKCDHGDHDRACLACSRAGIDGALELSRSERTVQRGGLARAWSEEERDALRDAARTTCPHCAEGSDPKTDGARGWKHVDGPVVKPCRAAYAHDLILGQERTERRATHKQPLSTGAILERIGPWREAVETWLGGDLVWPDGTEPQSSAERERLEGVIHRVIASTVRAALRDSEQCRCPRCEVKRLELWIEAATEATKEPRRLAGPRDAFLSRLHRAAAGFYDLGTTQAIYEAIGAFGRCTEEGDTAGLAILRDLLRDRTRERDRAPDRPDCGKKPRF